MSKDLLNLNQKSIKFESGDKISWDKNTANWKVGIATGEENNSFSKGVQPVVCNGSDVNLAPTVFSDPYSDNINRSGATYIVPFSGYYSLSLNGFYPGNPNPLQGNFFIVRTSDSPQTIISQTSVTTSTGSAWGTSCSADFVKLNEGDEIKFRINILGDGSNNDLRFFLSFRLLSRL